MGGGDLNMKKSWHPLLLKNQERVWLEEKKALEEKKKTDQLRKEKEEERQLQELQRLQEVQTGKKRTEKLEWMYSTPATGSNQNPNDLEDYLLGKKRVDKILTADDNAKLGASHKSFIAIQNANTARDIASKIREDPLLAIKQQEQAAYQALISNPIRLRELQERNGLKPKKLKKDKDKKRDKEEKRRLKEERRKEKWSLTPPDRYHSRSDHHRSPSRDRYYHSRRSPIPYHSPSPPQLQSRHGRSRSRSLEPYQRRRDRSRSLDRERSARNGRHVRVRSRSHDSGDNGYVDRNRSRSLERDSRRGKRPRTPSPGYIRPDEKRSRLSPPPRPTPPPPRAPRPSENGNSSKGEYSTDADQRAARLAAMSSNASALTTDRQERLKSLLEKEKADLEAEERARAKSKGMGSFLSAEQKMVYGGSGGLEERLRSTRSALVRDID